MKELYPVLIVGAIIGFFSAAFLVAFFSIKDRKESMGFERHMKDSEIIKRLGKYAKPYLGGFIAVFLMMLFSISYDILSPYLVGVIEETVKNNFALKTLYVYVGVYAGALIVSLVATYCQAILLQKIGMSIITDLRQNVFEHIETLSHAQLNAIPVGTLVTRVTNDTGSLGSFSGLFVNMTKNAFVIVGVFVAMLSLNYEFTLMVLCFAPFIVLFTVIFRKFARKSFRRVKDGTTGINIFLSENLSGMKIIQIFNREDYKMEEFAKRNDKLRKAKKEQLFVFGIFRPIVYMLYISCLLCLFYFGGSGYIKDVAFLGQTITSGTVVTFYMYISKFFNPIQNLAEQFNRLQSAFASAEKIFTVLDIVPDIVDAPDAIELETITGSIEFKHVWFQYVPDEWVLKDVSFKVEPNQTVAFVGATGSGKSTILSLICRNYDIQKGEILIDGIDVRKIKRSSLRRHFGQMLQDVFLFAGTIRSNIVLREESITDEEVRHACEYVNADKFIAELDHGLDEEVRERGSNFSAGQRQLLSFARTIVHKPEVMILDEATANIDTETELLIQDSLEKMMNIGTMLIVAHRLSTIQHADNIIVLSHGEIIEQGNHASLLKQKGKYYGLYMLQYEKQKYKR